MQNDPGEHFLVMFSCVLFCVQDTEFMSNSQSGSELDFENLVHIETKLMIPEKCEDVLISVPFFSLTLVHS